VPPDESGFSLSAPLDDAAIRRMYDEQVLSQEFYGDAYVPSLTAFVSAAAEQLAEAIVQTLAPRRVLDVGCGLGQIVLALRRLGVDAIGCDYSEAFIAVAPEEVRPHLEQADVNDLGRYATDAFDLVLCMEVLEHLPIDLVHSCIEELLRVSSAAVVVTTPSFGPNWPGRSGLPLDTPSWRADARAGTRFSQIVLAPDGRPHHGHLTLASYAWWTEAFRGHSLSRNHDLENAWLEDPKRPLWHHNWNMYVLHEATTAEFVPGATCVRQGNHGWHALESWPDGPVRWSAARAAVTLRSPCESPILRMRLSGGPDELVYPRELRVTAHGTLMDPVAERTRLEPGDWIDIRFGPLPAATGELITVTLDVPEPFRPSLLAGGGTDDDRELGVAVARIGLEAG
jgi:SAM-dependent methyltransferase